MPTAFVSRLEEAKWRTIGGSDDDKLGRSKGDVEGGNRVVDPIEGSMLKLDLLKGDEAAWSESLRDRTGTVEGMKDG